MAGLDGAGGSHARYFNNSAHSDVTIHFSGRQVKAHRVVLASQSEHFRAMFEGGFTEATARDIYLHDDDPEAMYGALAWCYGLYYDGETTLDRIDPKSVMNYSKRNGAAHTSYLVNLYATGGKYVMPKVEAHAEEYFKASMGVIKPGWVALFRHQPSGFDDLMACFETLAPLLYRNLGDSVKELRPALARAVWALAPGLKECEGFRQLMEDVPDLALDMLDIAIAAREESKGAPTI